MHSYINYDIRLMRRSQFLKGVRTIFLIHGYAGSHPHWQDTTRLQLLKKVTDTPSIPLVFIHSCIPVSLYRRISYSIHIDLLVNIYRHIYVNKCYIVM